jgi:hypothetical protein
MKAGERGAGLAGVLMLLAIVGLVLGVSLPSVSHAVRGARIRAGTLEMVSAMRTMRHRAIAESRSHGLVFTPRGDDWEYALFVDGDGDGLRTRDVHRGVDLLVGGPWRLSRRHPTVRPGFLPLERLRRIPPARGFLRDLSDPVRFGRSDIIACSANGRCSSGTLYLTDGMAAQWAVVLYGVTGRLRVLRYTPEEEQWEP